MKRFSFILAVQFVVVFAAGFLGAWAYFHWFGTPTPAATGEASWFRSQLGLGEEQAAKLESMQKAFQSEQMKLCEQHCTKRFELAELIKKGGGAVTPQMETLTREMSDIEARSEKLTIHHIFDIGKQLNEEQRAKFFAKVYDQICSSCRMDMGRMTLGKQASLLPPARNERAASGASTLAVTKSD